MEILQKEEVFRGFYRKKKIKCMPEFDLHNKRKILIGENRGRKVLHCTNKDTFIVKEMHHGF